MIGLDLFTDVKKLFLKTNLRLSVKMKIQQFENCRYYLCRNFFTASWHCAKTLHPDVIGVRRKSLEYVTS